MPLRFLFVSDSLDRIQHCCLLSWVPAKEHTGEGTDGETHDDAPRLYLSGYVQEGIQTQRQTHSQYHSDDSTGYSEQNRLDEELVQNINSPGSHTHAETDFTGSLRDTDIHDVHDTDTTDDERDPCHTA